MKKEKAIYLMALLCFTLIFVSCGNKSGKEKNKDTKADTTISEIAKPSATVPAEPTLICQDLGEDSMAMPHFNVMLSADGKETKIKTINACAEIPKSEYQRYDIPGDAICARGGWYAGGGDYYYLVRRNGILSVFEGWQDETQEDDGYHWKEISVK